MQLFEIHPMLIVVLMALSVALIRLAGFWLAGHLKVSPRVKKWLECLPGCIIVALVAPMLLQANWKQWISAVIVIAIMIKTDNIFFAIVVGIASAALFRLLL